MTTNTTTKSCPAKLRSAFVLSATAVLAGTGAITTAAWASSGPSHGGDVMQHVARQVLATGGPGYMARIDDGHGIDFTTAGLADRSTKRKLTAHDQFEVGSNTKTFTAALILQLVDQRKVKLDAPVETYLPGVVPNGAQITVRMLLNHTSGLFSYTGDEDFAQGMYTDPQREWTDQELLAVAFAHDPNFAPGADWSYSNTNYVLLGQMLQKLTGKDMPTLVRERIAEPLGLRDTYYANPRATNIGPGYAHGYAVSFAGKNPTWTDVSTWPIGSWGSSAGAVISTQHDLSRFFSGLLGGKLFSQNQLKQMKTTVPLPDGFEFKGGYGLGIFKIDAACGTVWGHGGDTNGHHSTAVATADGRRTAISDTTANLADLKENPGVNRFIEVALAAQDVTTCEMLDKPVPASVLDALDGKTPAAAH